MSRIHSLVIAASLSIITCSLLFGCSSDRQPGGNADAVTLRFWHFWSEPGQKQALEELISEFERENPKIDVELSELSWNDGKTKLFAAFNSETAPDVLELGSDWIAQFSAAGVLVDQRAMAGDSAGRFDPHIVDPGRWEGGIYAWPWIVDTRVLFVNKELLARAGIDTVEVDSLWSGIAANASVVRARVPEAYGFGSNGPDRHRLYKKILPFFWSNGGAILDPSGKPVVNSQANLAALEQYVELSRNGLIETQKQLDQLFVQGKVAYWISGSWLVDLIRKGNPGLAYGVSVLPTFPGGGRISFAGGEYLAISASSRHVDAAKRLVSFLTSREHALRFARKLPGGMFPADLSSPEDAEDSNPVRSVFRRQLATARMTPVHPKWLEIEEVIEEEVSNAIMAKKSPVEALNDAQFRVARLVDGQHSNQP